MINGDTLKYRRFTRTLNDPGKLIPVTDNPFHHIKDDVDHYLSLYSYNEAHLKQFKENGTVKGIKDVTTTRLLFDFDASAEKQTTFNDARNDAIMLVDRFKAHGVTDIAIWYSGGKGVHLELDTTTTFTPEEFRSTVFALAKGLKSFDEEINNASRIIRLPLTKHNKTGLYKVPLTLDYLKNATEDDIKAYAIELEGSPEEYNLFLKKVILPESILKFKIKKEEKVKDIVVIKELDMSKKPNWLTSCKYSLSQGYFKDGVKHNAFLALAATYRSQGLPEDVVFGMIDGVATLQARVNNSEKVPEKNLKRIVEEVFDDSWGEGTFSCKKEGWLQTYCSSHSFDCQRNEDEEPTIDFRDGLKSFNTYAKNIDNNTIKTGIKELDDKLRMQVGHLIGFLAAPGVGKTSMALSILTNTSLANIPSIFFSYDMHKDVLVQKIIQRETGYEDTKVFDIYKNNDEKEIEKIDGLLSKNYENIWFCTKSGQTLKQMKNTIKYREQKLGKEIKLIVIDYLELVQSEFSDSTAASMQNIQGLREICNDMGKAVIILLQPNKMSTKLNEPVTSYNAAKGSGSIGAACTAVLTAHRPGYSSREPEKDRFFSIDCVKSRTGPLFSLDFGWHGLTGKISSLTHDQKFDLKNLRAEIEQSRATEDEF